MAAANWHNFSLCSYSSMCMTGVGPMVFFSCVSHMKQTKKLGVARIMCLCVARLPNAVYIQGTPLLQGSCYLVLLFCCVCLKTEKYANVFRSTHCSLDVAASGQALTCPHPPLLMVSYGSVKQHMVCPCCWRFHDYSVCPISL